MNKLTHIKFHAKRNYYEKLIKTNSNSSSQTWSIIKKIIDLKHSDRKGNFPSSMFLDNEMINTNYESFLDKLCDYFANIGASMSKNIPQTTDSSFKIDGKSCLQTQSIEN